MAEDLSNGLLDVDAPPPQSNDTNPGAVNGAVNGAANGAANGGVALGQESEAASHKFSWLDPHPIFVIVLVGAEERPFGMQKDFLCAKSDFYRQYFASRDEGDAIEHIVKLPDTAVDVFAYAQNYLFTGTVFSGADPMPSYEVLIGVWKLGHKLGVEGLCDATLEAMAECRRATNHIPATPLLVQVWKDTPEGSSIRKLLLEWAAEYMRSSESRAEFARSLPQEVLSELVVAMSSLDVLPSPRLHGAGDQSMLGSRAVGAGGQQHQQQQQNGQQHGQQARRNVHYLDDDDNVASPANGRPAAKKQRHSDILPNGTASLASRPGPGRPPGSRTSLPGTKPTPRRRGAAALADANFSTPQKLNFCSDLLTRMLSGPGFWTRLVGPFKEPVNPVADGVPDYLSKVSRPMDLGTMRDKMAAGQYADDEAFLADMQQIFSNCYTYWTKKDPMWTACEKLQRTFEEKYGQMNKWIAKMEGVEGGEF